MINKLQRAEMFVTYSNTPILYLNNLFGDGSDFWFLANNFKEANPSNHIHMNELVDGRDITFLMNNANQYDQQLFLSQLAQISRSNLTFPQTVSWIKIK